MCRFRGELRAAGLAFRAVTERARAGAADEARTLTRSISSSLSSAYVSARRFRGELCTAGGSGGGGMSSAAQGAGGGGWECVGPGGGVGSEKRRFATASANVVRLGGLDGGGVKPSGGTEELGDGSSRPLIGSGVRSSVDSCVLDDEGGVGCRRPDERAARNNWANPGRASGSGSGAGVLLLLGVHWRRRRVGMISSTVCRGALVSLGLLLHRVALIRPWQNIARRARSPPDEVHASHAKTSLPCTR